MYQDVNWLADAMATIRFTNASKRSTKKSARQKSLSPEQQLSLYRSYSNKGR
jgi:hypothetical protein